jgi:hypothetical protein
MVSFKSHSPCGMIRVHVVCVLERGGIQRSNPSQSSIRHLSNPHVGVECRYIISKCILELLHKLVLNFIRCKNNYMYEYIQYMLNKYMKV